MVDPGFPKGPKGGTVLKRSCEKVMFSEACVKNWKAFLHENEKKLELGARVPRTPRSATEEEDIRRIKVKM